MSYTKTNWQDLPNTSTPINASNLNKIEDGIAGAVQQDKTQINFTSWHSVILTRSDSTYIYLILYGTDRLKEGTYSIQGGFTLYTFGTTESTFVVPTNAISSITRHDYGFEVVLKRANISGIAGTEYNGIAVVGGEQFVLMSS